MSFEHMDETVYRLVVIGRHGEIITCGCMTNSRSGALVLADKMLEASKDVDVVEIFEEVRTAILRVDRQGPRLVNTQRTKRKE